MQAAPEDLSVRYITLPASTLITETLTSFTPMFNGQRSDFLMAQVCHLARGEKTQQEVNAALRQNNIVPEKIPASGNTFSMLVNGNIEQQQMACASYLATSFYAPVNNVAYTGKQKVNAPATQPDVEAPSSWKFWQKTPEREVPHEVEVDTFNQDAFINDARIQLAVAHTTAQLYGLIANNTPNSVPLTMVEYRRNVAFTLKNYAPEYLRAIETIYLNSRSQAITVNGVTALGFSISDEKGHELVKEHHRAALRYRDIDWLGNSKILGKEYFVNLKIIEDPQPVSKSGGSIETPRRNSLKR